MPMRLAAGKIVLDFYNNEKAALKNKKLKEFCEEIRKKFNISILEVADFDDPERCVIGFSAVTPENWDKKKSQSFLDKIKNTIDQTAFARVTLEDCSLIDFD